jgi:PAS domain S-box-containing protein
MAWMITKENGAVAFSDWLAEEASAVSAERQALVEAFRAHPPISLKLTFHAPPDPFEMAATDPAAAAGPTLFSGRSRLAYDDLLDRLPMMIQVIDAEGTVESASQATAELLGYAPEEIVGRQALSLFTERSRRDVIENVLPQFFASGRLAGVAVQLVGKGGGTVNLTMTAAGDRNEAGRIVRVLTVFAVA